MDFNLTPELEALKQTIRQIVRNECIPLENQFLTTPPGTYSGGGKGSPTGLAEEHWGQGDLPTADWDRLEKISRDTGIYTMHVPEKYGGGDMGMLGYTVVDEETKRSIVGLPYAEVPVMLYDHCTKEQEEKYLYPCINGKKGYAFAQTEPQAGSDPGGMMETTAVRDGDDWILNGTKMFVSGAATADFILLLAVTDPEKRQRGGVTMFIIDKDTPGVTFTPIRVWVTPLQPRQFFIHLDNVRLPSSQILGEVGEGFALGQRWLTLFDRLLRGTLALGIMTRGLEMATEWAKQRITFGRPISDRQAIQWMLVDIYIDILALRGMTRRAAWRADQGEDVRVECSLVKYCGAEWGFRSIDKIMQIFGGIGETLDMPIPHWYHTLRHGRIGGGTSEIHRFIMARGILNNTVSWEG